jgi:hypothetical protein
VSCRAIADSPAFWVALTGGLTVLYIVPTLIGIFGHVECFGLVIILNTSPIAWSAALVVACMMPRKDDR